MLLYPFRLLVAVLATILFPGLAIFAHGISSKLGQRLLRTWARIILALFSVKVQCIDQNQIYEGPCVFIQLNQMSLFDAVLFSRTMPAYTRMLSNIEFAMIPFLGWAMAMGGNVVVRRESLKSSQRAFQKCNTILKNKENLTLSIEGQRSKTGHLGAYKKGPIILAKRNTARIVPVTIHGSWNILSYGSFVIRPGRAVVVFHQAISPASLRGRATSTISTELRSLCEAAILEHGK